jgi:hypothetical protein
MIVLLSFFKFILLIQLKLKFVLEFMLKNKLPFFQKTALKLCLLISFVDYVIIFIFKLIQLDF